MRFFAHDGKDVHGPSAPEELLKLPGFDGDTLVCPVGSENSSDWKPALAYPPFREALLAPGPKLTPLPAPATVPPPPTPTRPCPGCKRANPPDAAFCNGCGARMDGRAEPRGPKRTMANARETEPEPDSIAASLASPPEIIPGIVELESAGPVPENPPASAPEPPAPRRKILLASFAGAALASAGVGWRLFHPARAAAPPAAESTPSPAAAPVPAAPVPPPATAAAASLTPIAPAPPAAVVPKAAAVPKAAPRAAAKRARRKLRARRPAPAPIVAPAKDKALIDSLESGDTADAAKPAAPAAADSGMMMPGVPRPVPPKSAAKPAGGAAPAAAKTAAPAADGAEDETTRQVREQFTFCAQLLAQGAYEDHFDTCLCADARQAAPYLGRRGSYAAELKKSAAAGTLEASAAISGIVLDGGVAKVTADWKQGGSGAARTETESWRLDDGLWCRSP